jgi:hypothetical protein
MLVSFFSRAAAGLLLVIAAVGVPRDASSHPDLKVAGVSLLMTSGEAMSALREHGVAVQTTIKTSCLADYLAGHRSIVPISGSRDGHCVEMFQARYAGGSLLLFFTEDVPKRPGISVVTSIALNFPTDNSVAERLAADAGPPSRTDGNQPWTLALWCLGFRCTDADWEHPGMYRGPTLFVHRGAGLTLEDDGAGNRRNDAVNRILAAHNVRRVP